jgi:hypothetical protein
MSFSIADLIQAVGVENVKFQPLNRSIASIQLVNKGKESKVAFFTDPALISPDDAMRDKPRNVGFVLWIPQEHFERACEIAKASP